MPKILINEIDKTSPGLAGNYSNYAVLIAGFTGRTPVLTANATDSEPADLIQPDSNGIYEFTSLDDFENTIGKCAPKMTEAASGNVSYHYGNQMAYELLKLGYPIIYIPLKTDSTKITTYIDAIKQLKNDSFWAIFKDKASYDFRFITHGLLKSDYDKNKFDPIKAKKVDLEKAFKKLLEMIEKSEAEFNELDVNNKYEVINAQESKYTALLKDNKELAEYPGLTYETEEPDPDDASNVIITKHTYDTLASAFDGVSADLDTYRKLYDDFEAITTDDINAVNGCIARLAEYISEEDPKELPGRGDCVALLEVDEATYIGTGSSKPEASIINAIEFLSGDAGLSGDRGKFCAVTVPSVVYKLSTDPDPDKDPFKGNKKFPGAFHYLACFINSLKLGFAEWYAAAGYTRGVSSYTIDYTTVKLGEIAINALEPRYLVGDGRAEPKFACNVIANFRGSYYLWGNRTAYQLGKKGNLKNGDLTASSFLNIRHLCSTIKKQLYVACRMFTFDPNSDTLWFNFVNAIKPTLDEMKADQGIRDYKILKVATDKKATLKAKIRIIPIEAVEDFDLEVSLEDSFGETTAVVTE